MYNNYSKRHEKPKGCQKKAIKFVSPQFIIYLDFVTKGLEGVVRIKLRRTNSTKEFLFVVL